jgi:putative hydrolase of the HAD superfamily
MTRGSLAVPRALLIDLDDTLIDDSGSAESAWIEVCAAAARDVSVLDSAALLAEIHRVRTWYWSDPERHRVGRADLRASTTWIVQEALRSLGYDDADLARAIAHAYRDRREEAAKLLPGAVETLAELVSRGFRLAMLTNGAARAQRAKIERFDLARYFHYILVEGEFGHGKPDERVYHAAMRELEVTAAETWMVGDNFEWEVVVPRRLGLRTVWVDRHGRGVPTNAPVQPDFVIASLGELLTLLQD